MFAERGLGASGLHLLDLFPHYYNWHGQVTFVYGQPAPQDPRDLKQLERGRQRRRLLNF